MVLCHAGGLGRKFAYFAISGDVDLLAAFENWAPKRKSKCYILNAKKNRRVWDHWPWS